ncbi:hypothetical protein C2845_PM05G07580 [Panicum miliaceum]|uniref:Core Histone H2A/H2B/H3 domain-containing protein n=1 Tax=Panicum miliaceum TaxID=4540 RepID=A0A3L6T169_PANMI|nr:hypothetical protein C2845_PM05G07580 [Panicum miliaceum]
MSFSEQQMVEEFWRKKQHEIEAIEDFGERTIPMTRLRKVICAEKGKMMMTFDTPSFLTKACEIFVQELSFHAWMRAKFHHRSIILDSDIAEAIGSTNSYDFLNDVLHAHHEEHYSASHAKSTKKSFHIKFTNQPSTSSQPHFDQYPTKQFIPQLADHSPAVHIPPHLAATNIYQMPIPVPLPPQGHLLMATTTVTPTSIMSETIPPMTCTTRGLEFFGNNTVATFGAMTSLRVPPEALPNIQNNNNMSTVAYTDTCFVSNSNTSNVNAQDGSVTLHYPCAHQISFQLSSPSPLTNSDAHISTDIVELKHRRQDFAHIRNTSHVSGVNGATNIIDKKSNIGVDDAQQQDQGEESDVGNHQNVMHGTLDAEVIATTNMSKGDNNNINWDEIDMADDSLLARFWEDVMMDEDLAYVPAATSNNDVVPLPFDIPQHDGFGHEPYILDDIVSVASTGGKHS